MRVIDDLLNRRRARRYQRWTEVDVQEDYGRRAGIGTAIAGTFFLLVIALMVVGLVLAR
jgi:ABC-type phosphate transport system permease subunit